MTRVRGEYKKLLKIVMARNAVLKEVRDMLSSLADSLYEIRVYLEHNKETMDPMSYDMIDKLFGSLDTKLVEEVLRDALLHSARARLQEALEDSQQRDK